MEAECRYSSIIASVGSILDGSRISSEVHTRSSKIWMVRRVLGYDYKQVNMTSFIIFILKH